MSPGPRGLVAERSIQLIAEFIIMTTGSVPAVCCEASSPVSLIIIKSLGSTLHLLTICKMVLLRLREIKQISKVHKTIKWPKWHLNSSLRLWSALHHTRTARHPKHSHWEFTTLSTFTMREKGAKSLPG